MNTRSELAWEIFKSLREEVISTQKIRSQVFGFKITFIATAIAAIWIHAESGILELLALPAFAAIFFDSIIAHCGFSLKRISYYCKKFLEPKLRDSVEWPENEPLWEEFMNQRVSRKNFFYFGNIGLTTSAVIPAAIILFSDLKNHLSVTIGLIMVVMYVVDVMGHIQSWRSFLEYWVRRSGNEEQ